MTLYEAVQEFWVAEHEGEVVGCGALHVLWSDSARYAPWRSHPR